MPTSYERPLLLLLKNIVSLLAEKSRMIFKRKTKKREKLLESFGDSKEDHFNFQQIEQYFRKKDHSGDLQTISDKTCNDIDFEELFTFLDRTQSRIGQQFLYNKLRSIPAEREELPLHEKIISELTKKPELRVDIQLQLQKINDIHAYYLHSLFQDEPLQRPKWYFVIPLLSFTALLSFILMFFNPQIFFVFFIVLLANIGFHFWNKRNLYLYLNSLPQLLKLHKVTERLYKHPLLRELNPTLLKSINSIGKIRNRTAFISLESKLQGDLSVFIWGIFEIVKIVFLLEPLILFMILKEVTSKRKDIEALFEFAGEADSLISIASLRNGLEEWCIPEILPQAQNLKAENAYHPLIKGCVKNSIHLQGKSVLLTGSNMSGKTTFIRTIGLNVLTGLTLNTCFADKFMMPKMKMFSAIRISDDLMNHKSYYFEEVLTIKEMIEKSRDEQPGLFLMDEIFKGTNTVERISAGKAVLSYLAKEDNIVFVSTHDVELTDLLQDEYELYHFSEIVSNKTIDFDYKLKDGNLKNRNAIRILEINEYPAVVIKEALELSAYLDNAAMGRRANNNL